jgi:hypothetical protein
LRRRCGIGIRKKTNNPIRKEGIVEEERLKYRSCAAEGRKEGCIGKERGLQREGERAAEGRREGCGGKKGVKSIMKKRGCGVNI